MEEEEKKVLYSVGGRKKVSIFDVALERAKKRRATEISFCDATLEDDEKIAILGRRPCGNRLLFAAKSQFARLKMREAPKLIATKVGPCKSDFNGYTIYQFFAGKGNNFFPDPL
jgi:hypothetical protein